MKNKRGWIRILEATISILLISSVLVVVYSQQSQRPDSGEYFFNIQKGILKDISSRSDFRGAILSYSEALGNSQVLNEVNAYIASKVPSSIGYRLRVCELGEPCRLDGALTDAMVEAIRSKELYVEETVISAEVYYGAYSPKKVKLFFWEDFGDTPESRNKANLEDTFFDGESCVSDVGSYSFGSKMDEFTLNFNVRLFSGFTDTSSIFISKGFSTKEDGSKFSLVFDGGNLHATDGSTTQQDLGSFPSNTNVSVKLEISVMDKEYYVFVGTNQFGPFEFKDEVLSPLSYFGISTQNNELTICDLKVS